MASDVKLNLCPWCSHRPADARWAHVAGEPRRALVECCAETRGAGHHAVAFGRSLAEAARQWNRRTDAK